MDRPVCIHRLRGGRGGQGEQGGGQPVLTVANVGLAEGNSGNTAFDFVLSLSEPAGEGGVSFDVSTSDGTATAGSDYVAIATTAMSIAEGDDSAIVTVQVVGDTDNEADETFFVDVAHVTGALPVSLQATGTILSDDFNLVPVHAIQGAGASSPLLGQTVITSAIVTAVRNNGFFLQMLDAEADANPLRSEEHTSELQPLMRISYAVFCLNKKHRDRQE